MLCKFELYSIIILAIHISLIEAKAQQSSLLFSRGGNMYFDGNENLPFQGSPYFSDDWLPSEIKFENGQISDSINVMIDLYASKVIKQTNGDQGVYLDKTNIIEIRIFQNNQIHVFKPISFEKFLTGKERHNLIYEVLSNDDSFVLEYKVKFINGEDLNKGRALVNPDYSNKFEQVKNHYVLMKDGYYREFKLSKKGILKVFENKKDDIKKFIDSNNFDSNDYNNINEIIQYYYSLGI
jgi:hypothetical protein